MPTNRNIQAPPTFPLDIRIGWQRNIAARHGSCVDGCPKPEHMGISSTVSSVEHVDALSLFHSSTMHDYPVICEYSFCGCCSLSIPNPVVHNSKVGFHPSGNHSFQRQPPLKYETAQNPDTLTRNPPCSPVQDTTLRSKRKNASWNKGFGSCYMQL